MKRGIYPVLFVIGVVAVGVAAWLSLRQPPSVSVGVINNSHKEVTWVKPIHEKGAETIGQIPVGPSRLVAFRTRGETSYSLNVRFADGTEPAPPDVGYQHLRYRRDDSSMAKSGTRLGNQETGLKLVRESVVGHRVEVFDCQEHGRRIRLRPYACTPGASCPVATTYSA